MTGSVGMGGATADNGLVASLSVLQLPQQHGHPDRGTGNSIVSRDAAKPPDAGQN